ncbi:hypothetical protein Q9R08_16230 [Microbacterium sp. QXD-8]|uniref:Uncharacterized protein n=1 Tax=Microbacterium psychrotolerans TaxID=3068321 RepID=A0ABU0Z4T0_9MICO|nr:hypothetical protein [Microbacterium sp. QXD-8]MDQ7879542.1 hypothetical protein [Microbacterium sp. QXD-8]
MPRLGRPGTRRGLLVAGDAITGGREPVISSGCRGAAYIVDAGVARFELGPLEAAAIHAGSRR